MPTFTFIALVLTFLVAFAATVLLMPPVMRLCMRRGWVAVPGGRRLHARVTPNVGGIAIYGGFVMALLFSFVLSAAMPVVLARTSFEVLRLVLVLLGGTTIFLVMWLDDVRELSPRAKLTGQLVAALIAVGPYLWDHTRYLNPAGDPTEARGIILTAFNFPFISKVNLWDISPWLAIGATLFWIVAMDNTINFSDGMDGLAAGISLIAAIMLSLNAVFQPQPQYTIAMLPLALAGACTGFLVYNFPPARIFMGDSGAEFLGYALAVSAIIGGAKLATVLLVLGVPILDVAWLIISRLMLRRSPAHGGRDHLHHRLLDLGFSPRQILLFFYTLSASFGLLGISGADQRIKLLALTLLGMVTVGVLAYVARRTRMQQRLGETPTAQRGE